MEEVRKYKSENNQVVGLLAEIAARKAELVNKTPFDSYEDNLALKVIDDRLNEIYNILKTNLEVTKAYVEKAMEPIEHSLEELQKKVDILLPHPKVNRETLPLRDPVDHSIDLFSNFI